MGDVEKVRQATKVETKTKFEAIERTEISEIDKLNDDCLIEIFQRLTKIADKIRIERVCKRWKNLSQRSWNNFKSLDLSAKTWGTNGKCFDKSLIRSIVFDKIIRLSGKYLTRISTDLEDFSKFCHLLPHIRELQLKNGCEHNYSQTTVETPCQIILSWLKSHGKIITLFQMRVTDYRYFQEKDFARFLGQMKQLKSLCLEFYMSYVQCWTGICLLELPFEIIQEIILSGPIKHNILAMMLKKCKKLQTFSVSRIEGSVDEMLKALSSQVLTLKNLKLDITYLDNQSVLLSTMSALIYLEKLYVDSLRFITDAFLEVVGKGCKKLTYLNLCDCMEITDVGISSICNLEKLTLLKLYELPKIRNPPLEQLTSLVVLDLSWCRDIKKECLCSFLRKAHQLWALYVNDYSFVTKELLNAVSEASLKLVSEIPPSLNILELDPVPVTKYGVENAFRHIDHPEVLITARA